MDPNVMGGMVEGVLGIAGGLSAGIVVTVFAYRMTTKKSGGNGKVDTSPVGWDKTFSDFKVEHGEVHKELSKDVKDTRIIVEEIKTDVKWLTKNGNSRGVKK